jgi:hypothetical protein
MRRGEFDRLPVQMLAEEVNPDLVHRQPEHSNIEKAAELARV